MVKRSTLFIVVTLIVASFGIGIYLQDLKHRESTTVYWKANRHNMKRFNNIQNLALQMNSQNWRTLRDSIYKEMDTLVILRFRKEVDSLDKVQKPGL